MKESKEEEDVISDTWANRYIPTIKIYCCRDCPFFKGESISQSYISCEHPMNINTALFDLDEWARPEDYEEKKSGSPTNLHEGERHPQCPIESPGLLLLPMYEIERNSNELE